METNEKQDGKPVFKLSQLKNPKFYEANREAILQALKEGRVEADLPRNVQEQLHMRRFGEPRR